MMTSKNKCQTSDAIDFNPPNSMVHSPPQTVRTGSLHRMLVAHTLLLLLTTEARRAQRNFIFCPIGRRRSGKRTKPFGQVLENQLGSGNIWCSAKGASAEGGGSFPWPPPARHASKARRAGLPARGKTTLSVSSVSLWFISLQCPLVLPLFAS